VHVPLSHNGPILVIAVWDSAEAYGGWRNHSIRDDMTPLLEQVVDVGAQGLATSGGVYEIVVAASRSTAAA
jgi:hypothetical protein